MLLKSRNTLNELIYEWCILETGNPLQYVPFFIQKKKKKKKKGM